MRKRQISVRCRRRWRSWRWYRGWLRKRLRPGTKRVEVRHRRTFARVETGRLGPDIHDAATSCGRLALQCRSPCKAAPALELRPPASTADGIRPLWSRLSTRPRKRSAAFILLLLLSRSYILYHRFLINSSRSEPVSRLITYPAFRFFVFHPISSTRLIELIECIVWIGWTTCNFTFILTMLDWCEFYIYIYLVMDSRQKISDSLSDVNTSDVFNVFNSMGMFFLEISIYTEYRSFFTRTECNSKWLCTSVLHVQLRNLFTNIALLLIGDYYKSSMNHSPIELPRETCVEIKNAQRVNILGSI